jgi:ligand-binding sensor domain-containing protein
MSLSISEDSKGRLWFGTDDGAVSRFEITEPAANLPTSML